MHRALIVAALSVSLIAPTPSRVLAPLSSLWSWLSGDSALKEGCGMDPDGHCAAQPVPEADAGCGMDPNGSPKCS